MTKRILQALPYLFLVGYIGFNEWRLRDYVHVREDAIIAVHYPELAAKIRAESK